MPSGTREAVSGKDSNGKLAGGNALNEEHIIVVLKHRGAGNCSGKWSACRALGRAFSVISDQQSVISDQ